MKSTKPVLIVLLLGALAGNINAQEVAEQKPILADVGNSMTTDYRIKAADVVTLYILRMPELSRDYTVSARGTIEVPFLGEIDVLKKTSREVAARVADGLRGDFLVDPQVIATVKATLVTHRYFIQGAVRTPGVYNFETRPSLLELISVAGGLEPT
ncbi:MAG TPA: polysaccharide biosynthesis/export family protein, partial [Terriglobia bacterium]|nr:polysaccharide biosynthesis/export family protein [Terriglobia bacterium]